MRKIAAIGALALGAGAAGETFVWLDASSGSWVDAARWSPTGSPGAVAADDSATIDASGGAYSVTLSASRTIGALTLASGDATLRVDGSLTLRDASIVSAGSLVVDGSLRIDRELTLAGGTLAGDGAVTNTRVLTLLDATAHSVGSFTQTITGALAVAIGPGGAAGSLAVAGHATLGGALLVDLELPDEKERGELGIAWGDEFEVLGWGTVGGGFLFVALPEPVEGLVWWGEVRAGGYVVGVRAVGDVDRDGVVGFKDLNAVLAQFGEDGGNLAGDADEDGVVGFADLNAVLSQFGESIGDRERD